MVVLFWLSFAAIAYVYAGYPLLLTAWARLRPHRVNPGLLPGTASGDNLPGISIVIAARNEAARLPGRIQNLVELDYPADRRQIIVVSDGSTDETAAKVARLPIELVSVPAGGKALALNAGVARARFDFLVFADARQVFAPDALVELIRPFRDPQVGAVTGELLLEVERGRRGAQPDRRTSNEVPSAIERRRGNRRSTAGSTIADGVGLYWRFEKQLRRRESTVASTLGATGAIYAMRRSLWQPLPADTLLDDVLAPMRCVLAGYRVVFNPRAQAFDRTAAGADAEARRKIRTLAGNYQILWLEPRLLLPWRNRVWLQYLSHKVGRLLVPYALLTLFVASIAMAVRSLVYAAALAAQCLFYLLAGYGAWLDHRAVPESAVAAASGGTVVWSGTRSGAGTPGRVNA
jgi:cellulose synthase/poly-beta-1,6-N-acetylglucosamine synthase-like glycosyltransferase